MMVVAAPNSKRHLYPSDFYKCIFDEKSEQITQDEYETILKAWGLN